MYKNILLVGHPNVGKSVIFSRITGINAIVSNYPGTTINYYKGKLKIFDNQYNLIDSPGIYTLDTESGDDATKVTLSLLQTADLLINVVDASHLERHLPLTLELLALKKPIIIILNMIDEARQTGIQIDVNKLQELLQVSVIPTVGVTGEGISNVITSISTMQTELEKNIQLDIKYNLNFNKISNQEIWKQTYDIVKQVQKLFHKHKNIKEHLENLSIHPIWGFVLASIIIFLSYIFIRLLGELLISGDVKFLNFNLFSVTISFEWIFEKLWKPVLLNISALLLDYPILHDILIGKLIDNDIDFMQSFGILTSGLFIPFAAVLPYIVSFYLVISILEDIGYLPRLAVFLDNLMHKIGLHGYAIIPIMLGLGCNVSGILATRILETYTQRFIAITLISIAVPCTALQAMIIGLLGQYGTWPVVFVYLFLFVVLIIVGFLFKIFIKDFQPELILEIPPYRMPYWNTLKFKLKYRIFGFMKEALPIIMISIFIVNIFYSLHLFDLCARIFEPIISKLWGLPKEAIVPLILGLLRKELGMGMFLTLGLSLKQLVVGTVVLAMSFPCIASFSVLFKELGFWGGIKSTVIIFIITVICGSIVNFLFVFLSTLLNY